MQKNILIQISEFCNRNCEYCYQNGNFNKCALDYNKIDCFLKNNVSKEKKLNIIGGEPLLFKKILYYIITNYTDKFKQIIIFTNLEYLSDDDTIFFKKYDNIRFIVSYNIFKLKQHISNESIYLKINKLKSEKILFSVHSVIPNLKNLNIYFTKIFKHFYEYIENINLVFIPQYAAANDYQYEQLKDIYLFSLNYPSFFSEEIYRLFHPLETFSETISFFKDANNCMDSCEVALKPNGDIHQKCLFCKSNISYYNKCLECLFKNICRPCNFDYNGKNIQEYKCRRMYNIMRMLENNFNEQKNQTKLYNIHLVLGKKCNKACSYCFEIKRNMSELDLKKFEIFLSNNYMFIDSIDNIVGGEPLLYLNQDYNFLFKYFKTLNITTNGLIKNDYVLNNNFNIRISIDSLKMINDAKFSIYLNKIQAFNIILTEDVINNLEQIISNLIKYNKNIIIKPLFSYTNHENYLIKYKDKLKAVLKKNINIVKANYEHMNYNDPDCYKYKLNIEGEYITKCEVLYNFKNYLNKGDKYIISNNLETFNLDRYHKKNKKRFNKFNNKLNLCFPKLKFNDHEKWFRTFLRSIIDEENK